MQLRRFLGLAAITGVLCLANDARAFERQWHLGAGGGLILLEGAVGPALNLYSAYGLSDMFDFRLEVLAASAAVEDAGQTRVLAGSLGLTYKLDIIQWIPYFGLLVGAHGFDGPSEAQTGVDLGLSIVGGIDYALSRSWGLGLQGAFHPLLTALSGAHTAGGYTTWLLRFEHRWGW